MTTGRKIAAFFSLIGWVFLSGTCSVACYDAFTLNEDEARYVRFVNGTDQTITSMTLGFKDVHTFSTPLKPGDSTEQLKRERWVVEYGKVKATFEDGREVTAMGKHLSAGRYVLTLKKNSHNDEYHLASATDPDAR